jgi:hypothetical protein
MSSRSLLHQLFKNFAEHFVSSMLLPSSSLTFSLPLLRMEADAAAGEA